MATGCPKSVSATALRWKTRDDYVVSSKVGGYCNPHPAKASTSRPWVDAAPFTFDFDYSYDGTMRSLEDTLQSLAIERIDIAFIHDCDVFTHGAEAAEDPFQAGDGRQLQGAAQVARARAWSRRSASVSMNGRSAMRR